MRYASPTISSSRGMTVPVCGGVEAYNKRSFCVKYRSQGVQTSFHESTTPTSDSLGNTIQPRDTEGSGNARADLPGASKERNIRDISRHSRVLFECIPGTQGIWRVAPSYRLKTTEPPHWRSSLLHAHYKLSAEYRQKRRLRIQNRSAFMYWYIQTAGSTYGLPSKVRYTSFEYFTSVWTLPPPPGIHSPGTYSGSLHPLSRDISNSISRRLVDTSSRQPSFTSPPVSVTKHTEYGGLMLNKAKSELEPVQDIQFLGLQLHLDQGRASLPISKAREIMAHSFTQLGLRSHPTGSSTLEAPTMTLSFFRSDKPAFSTVVFGPPSPCHPTQAMAGPVAYMGISDCRCMDPCRMWAPHQCSGAQDSNICPPSLGWNITGPSCVDWNRQYLWRTSTNKVGPIPTACWGW